MTLDEGGVVRFGEDTAPAEVAAVILRHQLRDEADVQAAVQRELAAHGYAQPRLASSANSAENSAHID